MKRDRFVIVISILMIIVTLIGTTFSFFAASVRSNENVSFGSTTFGGSVEVSPLYVANPIVPMDDSDVMTGYENECVDRYGFGACYAYIIHVENTGDAFDYVGNIEFNVTDIENLKYLLLDEEENEYVEGTSVVSDTPQTLGDSFILGNGESKDFILIIWLTNLEGDQNENDAGGHFNAFVTYNSTYGNKITASISNN